MAAYRARRAPVEEEPQALAPELAEALARATREERLVALVAMRDDELAGSGLAAGAVLPAALGPRASTSAMRSRDALGHPLDYE